MFYMYASLGPIWGCIRIRKWATHAFNGLEKSPPIHDNVVERPDQDYIQPALLCCTVIILTNFTIVSYLQACRKNS